MSKASSNRFGLQVDEFPQPPLYPVRYPVILCHGYGALATLVNPGPMHTVCMQLRNHGVPAVAPNVVPYARIEVRAAAWVRVIGQILRDIATDRVNIIAHSMAGLDIRYALYHTGLSDVVASLTTISTPHYGSSLAELVLSTPDFLRETLAGLTDRFGKKVYPQIDSDAKGSLQQLTREYVQNTFNAEIRDVPGVDYFSWSFANGKGTESAINRPLMYMNQHIYEREGPNDGFVARKSAVWGRHMGHRQLSHVEQIGLMLSKNRQPEFDRLWRDVLQGLHQAGY